MFSIELVVILGAFLQELVSPFPSFVIFVPAGVALQAQGVSVGYIVGLAFVIGIARVLAGLVLYWLSGAIRQRLNGKKGKWLGIRMRDIQKLQAKLSKHGGWWAVFWLWASPVVPGTLISLASGFVKIPMVTFISATYVGAIVNALTYLCIGYFGLHIASLLTL